MNLRNLTRLAAFSALLASVSVAAPAALSQECPVELSALGRVGFDDVWAAVQSIPNQRGEYETTAVFEARQYAALTEIDPVYWIEMPLNGEFVSYDADTERLIVPVYAAYAGFLITATSANRLFGVGSDYARRYINLVGVRARSESIDTGSYRGETGLGVQRNVRQVDQITRYRQDGLPTEPATSGSTR